MPKQGCITTIELEMVCGIKKIFHNNKQSILWEKLHCQKCDRCKGKPMTESELRSNLNYNSVSEHLHANQEIKTMRDILMGL
jgi:hypothetical protein